MKSAERKKTLLLILPDGITLRNFIYSSFLDKAAEQFNVVVLHFVDAKVFEGLDAKTMRNLKLVPLRSYQERLLSKIFRYAKQWASLSYNFYLTGNATLYRNFPNYREYSLLKRIPFIAAKWLGRKGTQKKVLHLEKNHLKWFVREHRRIVQMAMNLLQSHNVDIVFNVHQRDVKSLPFMVSAEKLTIPTVNFIYSWDNLPKGRMANRANFYFVWSDYMKSELNRYYPDINDSQVRVTGTPQFEFYHTHPITAREYFAQLFGLNPLKEWILYSGDMTDASPYDQYYLEDVHEAWMQSTRKEVTELLFRRAPTDLSGRFAKTLKERPEIKVIDPLWKQFGNHQMSLAVTKEDVQLLVDLVSHCSTAINFGSTMAHDFAQYNKRVYYLNYEHPKNPMNNWTAEIFYKYTHFESMRDLDPVEWINSKAELSRIFEEQRPLDERISHWHNRITANTKTASNKIVTYLAELA